MRSVVVRDPAPSKWRYKLSRFWFARGVRSALTVWLPALCGIGVIAAVALHPSNAARVAGAVGAVQSAVLDHPSLALTSVVVSGAQADTAEQVLAITNMRLPASALSLDLDALRGELEALPAVQAAVLDTSGEGVLSIAVSEHIPVALWRSAAGLLLLDGQGGHIRPAAMRQDHPELPLLMGEGADSALQEGLTIAAQAQGLELPVHALVRVSERRWTLHLGDGQQVHLPEDAPQDALAYLIALHRGTELLNRDITLVDLRIPDRPVIRLSDNAVREVRRLRALAPEEDA
ncbi:MAG: cell division protein FtsQ/DivIB [Pseudomonadota bacterium]